MSDPQTTEPSAFQVLRNQIESSLLPNQCCDAAKLAVCIDNLITQRIKRPKPMAIKEGVNWSIDELAVQMQVCFTSYKLEDGSYGYFFDIEQCKKILDDIVDPKENKHE